MKNSSLIVTHPEFVMIFVIEFCNETKTSVSNPIHSRTRIPEDYDGYIIYLCIRIFALQVATVD